MINPLESLDNLVLKGFEKVTQYAAKHDMSKYGLLQGADYAIGIGALAYAAYCGVKISAREGFLTNTMIALTGVMWAYGGTYFIKKAKKKKELKEIYEYRKNSDMGVFLKSQEEEAKQKNGTPLGTLPSSTRFFFGSVGTLCLGAIFYGINRYSPVGIGEKAIINVFVTGCLGGLLAQSYLKDTSLILSPQRQAELEMKLQEKK